MAFQARHRWVIQVVDEALEIHNERLVEDYLAKPSNFVQLNKFFMKDGPQKIFVFYQPPADVPEPPAHSLSTPRSTAYSVAVGGIHQLFITDGESVGLTDRAAFFVKSENVDLDPTEVNEGEIMYGTVDGSPLQALEATVQRCFRPLLDKDGSKAWGKCEKEEVGEFLGVMGKFVDNVQEALKSLNTGLELRKPDISLVDRTMRRGTVQPEIVVQYSELLEEWCIQTEAYLEDSDQMSFEGSESGPGTELEFWRRRMQRLTSITEQLKTKECKTVLGVLSAATKSSADIGLEKGHIYGLLRRWKQIDMNITEAANEAKDNVKYLHTLDKFIEPLYSGSPASIIDTLPALFNNIKMIHTIARYYNTTERMTNLFMKITNQMITTCRKVVLGGDLPEKLWSRDFDVLLEQLDSCLRLNEAYQEQYRITKDKLLTTPKGKQFDFSETQIFGKFDLFCRRVIKLIDMLSTIQQFKALADHQIEGMGDLIQEFQTIVQSFRDKKHDLLDFHDNRFDRDYVEFNVRIADLEQNLQMFINACFESITSIEQSLALLRKFQSILRRDSLRSDLDSKFMVIFHNYGLDLSAVQDIYEKFKHNPPLARNMPPVSGNIMWSRHLLQRIESPMKRFEGNPNVLSTKDSRKIIKTYNKVAKTLVAFEYLWYEAWCRSIEHAKSGLAATLIVKHPHTGKLFVNFDPEIVKLVREAKCLNRMGIDIPESAKMVLLQEDKFKSYYDELKHALNEYARVMDRIIPVTRDLLTPHIMDLELKLRPGMLTLTWTSMNIDSYKHSIHTGLRKLEELVNTVNDIIENRVDKNLKFVSNALLVELPIDQSFSLDEFVSVQEKHVRLKMEVISAKNAEVEHSIEDLVQVVTSYSLEEGVPAVDQRAVEHLREHYHHLMYQALLNATKTSLSALKRRVCARTGTGFLFVERPFFEVDVQLSVPSVRLSPSLEDVQRSINKAALTVLRLSKSVFEWGQDDLDIADRRSFFFRIGQDIEVVKVVLLLTGAFQGTKNQVASHLTTFSVYDWLWKDDMEVSYKKFIAQDPEIDDFERELRRFVAVENEIGTISPLHNIGALSLNTKNLKLQLRTECRSWKVQYSDRVHKQAHNMMIGLLDYVKATHTQLNREVESLDTLRSVMDVLKEVRERESTIEMEINPILDMYQMLDSYLPQGCMSKEEMDLRSILRPSWTRLMDFAEDVTDALSDVQGDFKKKLMTDIRGFMKDQRQFRKEFVEEGPMVTGIPPTEAVERLKRFKRQEELLDRKLESYSAGEELFALRKTEFAELTRTKKEIALLDRLYGLYLDVMESEDRYRSKLWVDVADGIEDMASAMNSFDARCRRLPKSLREWEAYKELRAKISEFQGVLPLLEELSKESIRPRHWHDVMQTTGVSFTLDGDEFTLGTLLTCDLLAHKEEVEEIADSADRQAAIERKLAEIKEKWGVEKFCFTPWQGRDVPILKGFGQIIEDLEESQLVLQAQVSMRHVAPFKTEVQAKLSQLSDTADTLEHWVKVQMLWCSLESVFTGGDIAKQMPMEAKKFAKIDKDWTKVMTKAADTGFVVECCSNELLRNTLPILHAELEKCQKSLEGYLEQKRNKFPRFYFVSNSVLLQILSQGSDPLAVQPYYEKIFDSVDAVEHDRGDKYKILSIKSLKGSEAEVIPLSNVVQAKGNIEDWLLVLEHAMQMSMKGLTEIAVSDSANKDLRVFVDTTCGQLGLLGLQLKWTTSCQTALDKCKSTKSAMTECNNEQANLLAELSGWCLQDLGSSMNRTKIETLITIQVHQRDVFQDLVKLYKERKISSSNDFEWLKQARFYWNPDGTDRLGEGVCYMSICDVDLPYQYEYLGCKERLVITPLTDRAYITLTQALGLYLGGAPAGPAGTGKTETVKDLGRGLGIHVVVTNCTDQQRFTDMAKIFKGLCQAGLWGCFDEFNRIELPVLSVVAQQVLAITNAKRCAAKQFTFPGDVVPIGLNPSVGYFITMNPGYQGRQELPENLKALFRNVAMMIPDREIIIKVKLCSVGYTNFQDLARKFRVLYKLCEEQLSKQKHYDFGLRNILSVLRTAGKTKRDNTEADESLLLYRTLRDMNLSKLVAEDTPLFLSLLSDLFPGIVAPTSSKNPSLEKNILDVLDKGALMPHPSWLLKVNQLYDTMLVRHGIMLVGPAGSGKSTILHCLKDALSLETGIAHKVVALNPKGIRAEELFGECDRLSGEWLDGVFATIWGKFNDRGRKDITWLLCDGPVDAIWIENLNTVLDDNKILTLANGERIPMTDNVKLLFEVEDLRNASPATVSRAGIIYVSASDLDWWPMVKAWIRKQDDFLVSVLESLFLKYLGLNTQTDAGHCFRYLFQELHPVVRTPRVAIAGSICRLLETLLREVELSATPSDLELEVERLLVFCIVWAVGGLLESDERPLFDYFLRKNAAPHQNAERNAHRRGSRLVDLEPTVGGVFPSCKPGECIFDYLVDPSTIEWQRWSDRLTEWEYPSGAEELNFSSLLVETCDTLKAEYLISHLIPEKIPVMIAGTGGTAKTSTTLMYLDHATRKDDQLLVKKANFSSATTPGMFQSTIELQLDKRGGKNFGPPNNKHMIVFLDDINMPEPNEWGDQPTLETVRQLIEYKTVCFLEKDKRGDLRNVEDLAYIAAMNHPGGGRNDVPTRLKRHFFIFNMVPPSTSTVNSIYGAMLKGRFDRETFKRTLRETSEKLTKATIDLWEWIKKAMLPTPAKFHYNFNLRDISRVFQGILSVPKPSVTSEKLLVQLWRHECLRVFQDKLTTPGDKEQFTSTLNNITEKSFNARVAKEAMRGDVLFADFMRDDEYDEDDVLVAEAPRQYELGGTVADLRPRVEMFLKLHNEENAQRPLSLVLFDDALRHLLKISRILGQNRGNALLVGVGGSGRQSLTRLASFIQRHMTFQITMTKTYGVNSMLDDLRVLYKHAGHAGKPVTFIFTDSDVKEETFLEFINSILMTGEVTRLFPKDELTLMCAELRSFAVKERPDFVDTPENLVHYFIDRVRDNLHIVLCMSPVDPNFAERARRFPGMISGTTIDWFLPWPKEALTAVSNAYLEDFSLEGDKTVKQAVVEHMGSVHALVTNSCLEYHQKMRRHVYQTPRSYLSFLNSYKALYTKKLKEIKTQESRVTLGLQKLKQGAQDVEKMKIVLAEEERNQERAEEECNAMLSQLQTSSMEAKKESDAVQKIRDQCEKDHEMISKEKEEAEEDLLKAKPFLDEADRAVNSIKAQDINEIKKLPQPSDIIKLVFDGVAILLMEPLVKSNVASVTLGIGKEKRTFEFVQDSYQISKKGMLSQSDFLKRLFDFSVRKKDQMNEETIEFMQTYLEVPEFSPAVARNASKAAEGLCSWVRALTSYHHHSKVVKPKLEALNEAELRLEAAEADLDRAEQSMQKCKDLLEQLQTDFETKMSDKAAIEERAQTIRKKMEQATALINGLGGERKRWTEDQSKFKDIGKRLVGDCALASAFISYVGPFNQSFREVLLHKSFSSDLSTRGIPFSGDLNVTNFLVDAGTVGDWSLQGLPSDPLSVQNGILVTQSSRFPLLIDPQGQGLNWLLQREAENLPAFGVTSLKHPKLRDQLEFAMAEGKAMIIAGIGEALDPMMDPVLDKEIVVKARAKYIKIADRLCEYSDSFQLYMTTRLPNPHFSPEVQARSTVVDFTVTLKGLEEQLLGRVIQKEQKSLEDQLNTVLASVTNNTKALLHLDALLLERLTANEGNLLDDVELIGVLANTKAKATEVNQKLVEAASTREQINVKREQYRPVATRGSVLYFSVVETSYINCMYQTSLDQFLVLFMKSIETAERASIATKRVSNIIDSMTYIVYRYILRGLYEKDRLCFVLMLALKILMSAKIITQGEVALLLRGGAALNIADQRQKPGRWMANSSWLNVIEMSSSCSFLGSFKDEVVSHEALWKKWCEEDDPEKVPLCNWETRLLEAGVYGAFMRLMIVRALREDRTLLALHDFIRVFEKVTYTTVSGSIEVPALGARYLSPVSDSVISVIEEAGPLTPVIYLLSAGSDVTDNIENAARKLKTTVDAVSLGEGQGEVALKAMNAAAANGTWVLLQNCHLGLPLMNQMESVLEKMRDSVAPTFRLFITSEPHPGFPIGLLQLSTKVTNEPPAGLRAGLLRSFSTLIDQEKLERIDTAQWRTLVFSLAFLHSIVQERRKFGPLGWCVPYEFNNSDLSASLMFLEKHMYSVTQLSWPTLQYMVAEVQYGGRITDDLDRRMFATYVEAWLTPSTLAANFTFNPEQPVGRFPDDFVYNIPDGTELEHFRTAIERFPDIDSPEIFEMHPNADFTSRVQEVSQLLDTVIETQPKESGDSGGETREDIVMAKALELLDKLPDSYNEAKLKQKIKKLGGLSVPLNIFLFQEICRLQIVIDLVKDTLTTVVSAVKGEVVMTPEVMAVLDAVFLGKVPHRWMFTPGGDELSWITPTLGSWFTGLLARDKQDREWLHGGRPKAYWLTGFFNPQGFLTAMRQEVTRQHSADQWALDEMVFHTEVTEYDRVEQIRAAPAEGVYIQGLFLDGAAWSSSEGTLVESLPKQLFSPLPVLFVTAVTKSHKRAKAGDYGPYGAYDCPCYKYPSRTDRYLVFIVNLSSRDYRPSHWILRGVSLLCSVE